MGNICCQTETEPAFLEDDIPKVDQYQEANLPAEDSVLNDWIKTNNISVPASNEGAPIKVMKHKQENRYYYGDWKNGVPVGKGLFYEPSKLIFDGTFVEGIPEGFARIKFIEGASEFEGELKRGMANGNGRIDNLKQKYNFTGEWQNSKPRNGTLTFASDPNISNIYFQDFGKRLAIINYQDNRKYEGQVNTSRLVPHGKGKVSFPFNNSKSFYDGEWNNGEMHGKGIFQWTDGSSYDGEFIHGKREGQGKFLFPNGNYYDGYWIAGKQEGVGTLYGRNKEELKKGVWKAGAFVNSLTNDDWHKESQLSASRREKVLEEVKSSLKEQSRLEESQRKKESAIKQEKMKESAEKKSEQKHQHKGELNNSSHQH